MHAGQTSHGGAPTPMAGSPPWQARLHGVAALATRGPRRSGPSEGAAGRAWSRCFTSWSRCFTSRLFAAFALPLSRHAALPLTALALSVPDKDYAAVARPARRPRSALRTISAHARSAVRAHFGCWPGRLVRLRAGVEVLQQGLQLVGPGPQPRVRSGLGETQAAVACLRSNAISSPYKAEGGGPVYSTRHRHHKDLPARMPHDERADGLLMLLCAHS